jgi:hypothetical protein
MELHAGPMLSACRPGICVKAIRAAGEEALVQQLFYLGERLGEACLFAISELDIALLNGHRGRLRRFRFMFPDEERMNRVVNKEMR